MAAPLVTRMVNANEELSSRAFEGSAAASLNEIEAVQRKLSFTLPTSYVTFMCTGNGGEGFIGKSYLVLWKVEELTSMNAAYHVAEFVPGLFLFGSNGGGEAYGFDTRSRPPTIVSVPFIAMDLADAKIVASDFETFLSELSAP